MRQRKGPGLGGCTQKVTPAPVTTLWQSATWPRHRLRDAFTALLPQNGPFLLAEGFPD